jgi:hypothetical protein
VTLETGGVGIGSGAAGPLVVTSGSTQAFPITISPNNANVVLGITPGGQQVFYADGTAVNQTVFLQANEVDNAGDIITKFYGVAGAGYTYPTLTFTPGGSVAGITSPAVINTMPAAGFQNGNNAVAVTFDPSGAVNGSSLTYTVADGLGHTSSLVSIPYVTMSNSAAGSLTFSQTGVPQPVTIYENTTGVQYPDATLTASAPTCTNAGTVLATFGGGGAVSNGGSTTALTPASGSQGGVTYDVTATAASSTDGVVSCNLVVTSTLHASLSQTITINFPGAGGVTVNSRGRT